MGKALLKLFSVETLITVVVELLAASVHNPGSAKAQRLRTVVSNLHRATGQFLEKGYIE